jgi:hypothetical protein
MTSTDKTIVKYKNTRLDCPRRVYKLQIKKIEIK